jgi:hypothetical protein
MTTPEVEYVSAPEAALRLRIRTDEMGRILRSGKLPGAFKADGVWKVPLVAIEARIDRLARRASLTPNEKPKPNFGRRTAFAELGRELETKNE